MVNIGKLGTISERLVNLQFLIFQISPQIFPIMDTWIHIPFFKTVEIFQKCLGHTPPLHIQGPAYFFLLFLLWMQHFFLSGVSSVCWERFWPYFLCMMIAAPIFRLRWFVRITFMLSFVQFHHYLHVFFFKNLFYTIKQHSIWNL